VLKMARQGEYDNFHLAPKMMAPALAAEYPGWGFDNLSMAPFCLHDCFHTHWRWARPYHKKPVRGWGPGGPHEVVGAPMVPLNQDVEIVSDGESAFCYRAIAHRAPAGSWQVVYHHGSAYSVSLTAPVKGALLGLPPYLLALGESPLVAVMTPKEFPLFYWHLRYELRKGRPGPPPERLLIRDLAGVRDG
jgi:hypothetical protein